ncbi:chemotaxis protein CheW [Sphingomonas sp. NCPPB 2930]|uniref:chemotaxis protein CheW n=1 Tax=unclassified Sphingomonas TaxID=196159 RepID=UPI00285DBAD4|nr:MULTISPECIES: chemotaxis protein CheW [unclassified Sphingomonas]MDR6115294.1 purine-binding chemotaxis protein CheW [Sphingomonas sp. SORGH_AS_0789]MDR6147241.1 purine-binding chemotaxis protein CheW [Sphingomonas sp. SORGH_AS_0870]MDR6151031.1 purine-binding chemotaxis protein CheW [Sphingomonas sp. SORGH_AS_0742]
MPLFLIARIADQGVVFDADQVDSVVDIGEVVAVPRAEPSVRGLTALRSRVITVVDTRLALGLEPTADHIRRAVITRQDGHYYAMLVDALDDIETFETRPMPHAPPREGRWSRAAGGMVVRDGEPLLVLDLARLVPPPAAAAA